MSATETPPIANDAKGAHSLHRMVRLLALAVMEMQPECVTPARCMIRHGPNCRVTRWEAISSAIEAELRKQPNDPSSATRPTSAFDCNLDAMAGFAAAHG